MFQFRDPEVSIWLDKCMVWHFGQYSQWEESTIYRTDHILWSGVGSITGTSLSADMRANEKRNWRCRISWNFDLFPFHPPVNKIFYNPLHELIHFVAVETFGFPLQKVWLAISGSTSKYNGWCDDINLIYFQYHVALFAYKCPCFRQCVLLSRANLTNEMRSCVKTATFTLACNTCLHPETNKYTI